VIGTDSVRWDHVGVFLFEKSSIRCDTTVECRFAGGVACVRRQYKHVGAFDAHVSSERGNLTTERGVDSAAIIRSIEVKKKTKDDCITQKWLAGRKGKSCHPIVEYHLANTL